MSDQPDAGLLVVDKPPGLTSHDVVARVRRLAGTRRVGHAGTLDPMATGVLVLGVGRATRLLGHLTLTEKAYDATIRLGLATDTDDADGEVVSVRPVAGLAEETVRGALAAYRGVLEQVPAAVSAVKVDGRRAYQRVRAGEPVALSARTVTVHRLDVVEVRPALTPAGEVLDVAVSLRCSSGTYVRAIARDLGAALGVGGHLSRLRRTAVGPFELAAASTLEQLAEELALVPLADAARAAFPSLEVGDELARAVRHGRPVDVPLIGLTALFEGPELLALYRPADPAGSGHLARPVAVLSG